MAQVALALVASLAVLLGALLAVLGAQALGPGSYEVEGSVFLANTHPLSAAVGATVVLTNDAGRQFVETVGPAGTFTFQHVAPGGISLNITLAGYAPATVTTFASPIYSTQTTGLAIVLSPGSTSNATTTTLSPFPNLETFVASVGSGAALLGIVALLGGWATVVTARSNRPAVGVVGGAGGLLAPVALYFLALGGVFPELLAGTAALAAVGAFAAVTRSLEILQVGPEARTA